MSITAYPSYTDFNNLGDHVSYIALDEPLEGSSDLILQCRIKNIGYGDAGGRVCETNGLPIGGAQELALTDVTISLLESTIILKVIVVFGLFFKRFECLIIEFISLTLAAHLHFLPHSCSYTYTFQIENETITS